MDHSLNLAPARHPARLRGGGAGRQLLGRRRRLNLTHGAISRQIARLEAWLGLRVFERQARGVALTPEGQRLFQRTQEAFALIADTSDRWSEPRGAAVVRVASIPSVCGLWLMPRLARLRAAIRRCASCSRSTSPVDLADEGVDLAIRCGRGGLPGRDFGQAVRGMVLPDRRAGARGDDRRRRCRAAARGSADPRFRRLRLARLVRRPWPRLSAAPAGPPVRGLQSGARCRRLRPRHRAGAPAARAADGDRPDGPGRRADGAQSGVLLAGPAGGAAAAGRGGAGAQDRRRGGAGRGEAAGFLRAG